MSENFNNNLYAVNYLFRQAPGYVILSIVSKILSGLRDVWTNVILISLIINTVFYHKDLKFLALAFIGYLILVLLDLLLSNIMTALVAPIMEEKISIIMEKQLFQKIIEMDLEAFDNPDFYNNYVIALKAAKQTIFSAFHNIAVFLGNFVSMLLVAGIFIKIDILMLVLTIMAVYCNFCLNKKNSELQYQKFCELQIYSRRRDYIRNIFYSHEYAKDLKITNISKRLIKDYWLACDKTGQILKLFNKKLCLFSVLQNYIPNVIIINFLILLYTGYRIIILRNLEMGDFVTIYNGISSIFASLCFVLGSFLVSYRENAKYIKKLREFFAYVPKMKDVKKENTEEFDSLTLQQVQYCYPGSDVNCIDGISMNIKNGDKIAIVGYNGAGKSTLIKLLLRLYDVKDGQIKRNGINICDIGIRQYQKDYSVLFQDFQIYAATIAENIAMDFNYDSNEIRRSIRESGLENKVNEFELGIETSLLRRFEEGKILSGGEMQKLALARVLYHTGKVIILDEPTAALDPVTEYEFNQKIAEAFKNKSVIFISHRLTTTRMADVIYVMDKGQAAEWGTHQELLEKHGIYYNMWHIQADSYMNAK